MATDTSLAGEERIGGYRVIRTLLHGQNSDVLEVVQEGTGRRFALKEMFPARARDPARRWTFELEARLGMAWSHPNLIPVYVFVPDRVAPYFVMEFFPGDHLRLILNRRDRAGWLKARLHRIIEQAASAIAHLHDEGWVHRDIKPENVLVSRTGEVRVIDLALARRVPSGLGRLFARRPACEGTHSYMAPEQIRREVPAAAADIYSLGITCYELAAGRPPFRANSPTELLNKHIREPPMPPLVHDRSITPEFSELVMSMIRKKPEERVGSLHEFLGRFNRIRIYRDNPDPEVSRGAL